MLRRRIFPWTIVALCWWSVDCLVAPFAQAAVRGGPDASVAIIPIHDGSGDRVSTELAQSLVEALPRLTGVRVAVPAHVDAIREYAENLAPEPVLSRSTTARRSGTTQLDQLARQLASAKEQFLRFDTSAADVQATQVRQAFADDAALRSGAGALYAETLLTLALIYQTERRLNQMDAMLTQLADFAPHYVLSAAAYPPSVRERYEKILAQHHERGSASVAVQSSPPAADVLINGVAAGVTPLTLAALPAGAYTVTIQAPHYRAVQKKITVRSGESVRVAETLHWSHARENRSTSGLADEPSAAISTPRAQLAAAVRIAELARVQKIVTVNVNEAANGSSTVAVQVIDSALRAGRRPITMNIAADHHQLHERLAALTRTVATQVAQDFHDVASREFSPQGAVDPSVLTQRAHRMRPWMWAVLGVLAAGGAVGGWALTRGGGASAGGVAGAPVGSVAIQF